MYLFYLYLWVTISVTALNRGTTPNVSRTSQFTPDCSWCTRCLYCCCRWNIFTKASHGITLNLIINIFSKGGTFGGNCVTAIILGRRRILWSSMICTILTIQITGRCSITTYSVLFITSHVNWAKQCVCITAGLMQLCVCPSTLIVAGTITGIHINAIIHVLIIIWVIYEISLLFPSLHCSRNIRLNYKLCFHNFLDKLRLRIRNRPMLPGKLYLKISLILFEANLKIKLCTSHGVSVIS